jgi:hypothetical protein
VITIAGGSPRVAARQGARDDVAGRPAVCRPSTAAVSRRGNRSAAGSERQALLP